MNLPKSKLLLEAIEKGDIVALTDLLRGKWPTRHESFLDLNTALLRAVVKGHKFIVQWLLNYGADVSGPTGGRALMCAAVHRYADILTVLLKGGAPVDFKDEITGQTVLMRMAGWGCASDLVRVLVKHGADVNIQDSRGKTALMYAVDVCDFASVQALFESGGCDVNLMDNQGRTAKDVADEYKMGEVLHCLTESARTGYNPLLVAAWENNDRVAEMLIQLGVCCANYESEDGMTPVLTALLGFSLFYGAEWNGYVCCNENMIRVLAQPGVDLDRPHPGRTLNALMFVTIYGCAPIVEILLENGANVNAVSTDKLTALILAVLSGNVDIVEILCKAGADRSIKDANGDTALGLAVKDKHYGCLLALLKWSSGLSDLDIKTLSKNGMLSCLLQVTDRWPILLADASTFNAAFLRGVETANCELVSKLMACNRIDINEPVDRTSMLVHASQDVGMITLLLESGLNVNGKSDRVWTPLIDAITRGDTTCVSKLLEYGADVYVERNGETAVSLACEYGQSDILKTLLEADGNVNQAVNDLVSPLMCAVQARCLPAVETLIKFGIDINAVVRSYNTTPLIDAILNGEKDIVRVLVESGADVNAADTKGNTPLHHSVNYSHAGCYYTYYDYGNEAQERARFYRNMENIKNTVALLLNNGANPNRTNFSLETPLMLAAHYCTGEIVGLFTSFGARVDVKDQRNFTPLHLAVSSTKSRHLSAKDKASKVRHLLNYGADVNASDVGSGTPLMVALADWKLSSVKALLQNGAEINFFNNMERRSHWIEYLTRVVMNSRQGFPFTHDDIKICFKSLLDAGCYLGLENDLVKWRLRRLLLQCICEGETAMVQLLMRAGCQPLLLSSCDVSVVGRLIVRGSNFLWTTMCCAIYSGRADIVDLLVEACFFHKEDIKILQQASVKSFYLRQLENGRYDAFPAAKVLLPNCWSLGMWSTLVVSEAIGYGSDRPAKIRSLNIPTGLQDKLLHGYKH